MADTAIALSTNSKDLDVATRWCTSKGSGWEVRAPLGTGGTASVFEVHSPDGLKALKVYSTDFSSGDRGAIESKRLEQQLALRGHSCESLVEVFDGGMFENRLVLLMSRADGQELEKCLHLVPRDKIRHIMDRIARAVLFLRSRNLCHRDIKAANIFVSEDFERVTLLDISVTRNIYDPVGLGTDHDGKLPVVATARYSPPDYLFRLIEPGPELWHALDIYQLGALLHDLIMREPLFRAEYESSKDNRYQFAWIVATKAPVLNAQDVDADLLFTARRALDKDWRRRLQLVVEDFLSDTAIQADHALQLIGVNVPKHEASIARQLADLRARTATIADQVESSILETLRDKSVTAIHTSRDLDDTSKTLTFAWNVVPDLRQSDDAEMVELQVTIRLKHSLDNRQIQTSVRLTAPVNNQKRIAAIDLPDVIDESQSDSIVANQIWSAFSQLAVEIARAQPTTSM